MENFGKFCYSLILFSTQVAMSGYVFLMLWGWFIVTTFHAQTITFSQGLGIMLFVGFLKPKSKIDKDEKIDVKTFTKDFFTHLLLSAFVLLLGYSISRFV